MTVFFSHFFCFYLSRFSLIFYLDSKLKSARGGGAGSELAGACWLVFQLLAGWPGEGGSNKTETNLWFKDTNYFENELKNWIADHFISLFNF